MSTNSTAPTTKEILRPLFENEKETVKIQLILDPRKHGSDIQKFRKTEGKISLDDLLKVKDMPTIPAVIRVTYNRALFYHKTGFKCTFAAWEAMRQAKGNSDAMRQRKMLKITFDKVYRVVDELCNKGNFTFDILRTQLTGKDSDTFSNVWLNIIERTKKYNTASAYRYAYNSFSKFAGINVPFSRISPEYVDKWVDRMVDTGNGSTTIGMYTRAMRVAVNECIKLGKIKESQFPFGKERDGKVKIPRGKKRTYDFIDIDTINKIRSFKAPDDWKEQYAEGVVKSINLWLFSYLAGGANLADIAELTWTDYYFHSGGTELQFIRKKTIDTSDDAIEILIPIIPETSSILEKYGSAPELGKRVFPCILGDEPLDDATVFRRVQQANQNIRKHIHNVCDELNLSKKVSPTWARHSFKSNATHAGIPKEYVEMAMGHSLRGVEGNYMGIFPIQKRIEFTTMLLDGKPSLNGLSKGELQEQLKRIETMLSKM